jgi:glycosyltransferase involved in cell wall biosynthesis
MNDDPRKLKILIFLDHYLPGFRFGGIITAVAAMVEQLGDQLEFYVVTAPRDEHSYEIYPDTAVDSWNQAERARVFYTDDHSPARLRQIFREGQPDVVYLNSYWSKWTVRVLFWQKMRRLPLVPIVLAPRGTFNPQALKIKAAKKRLYRAVSDLLGLSNDVLWHATSEHEREDIENYRGAGARIAIAPDLNSPVAVRDLRSQKMPGRLRAVAISRLARMKNFEFLMAAMWNVKGEVELDLFGPIDEPEYWARLQREIKRLPANIRVRYMGLVAKHDVLRKLQEYDVHTLPSRGENYGYSIVESLSVGIPAVISDRTPWHGLDAAQAGFDLPLVTEQWTQCLQRLVELGAEEHERLRRGAVEFYCREVIKPENAAASLDMFRSAIAQQ